MGHIFIKTWNALGNVWMEFTIVYSVCLFLPDPYLPPRWWNPFLHKTLWPISFRRSMGLRWHHERIVCSSGRRQALIPVYFKAPSLFCSFSSACTPLKERSQSDNSSPKHFGSSFFLEIALRSGFSRRFYFQSRIDQEAFEETTVLKLSYPPSFTLPLFLIPFLQVPEAPTDGETKERVRIRARIRASERRGKTCWFIWKSSRVGPLWGLLYPVSFLSQFSDI